MKKCFKRFLVNFSIIVLSCLVSLVVMEVIVRVFIPQRVETPMDCFVPDASLGWRTKPNLDKLYTSPDFVMHVITNERSFRDELHSYEKTPGTFRILGIGDSFLFGYGIDSNENVLVRLQELSNNSNLSTKNIETINLGVSGYDPDQYYNILKYEGAKYSPDLAIVFFYTNDWIEGQRYQKFKVSKEGFLLTGQEFSFESIRSILFPLRVFLKRNSQLYILVRGRLTNFLRKKKLMKISEIGLYQKDYDLYQKFAHTFLLIEAMNVFCREKLGCSLIVCMIPETLQVRPSRLKVITEAYKVDMNEYDWLKPQNRLKNFCSNKGIYWLDLTPDFREVEKRKECYFDIDPHWNESGHSLAADKLFKFLKDNKVVSSKAD